MFRSKRQPILPKSKYYDVLNQVVGYFPGYPEDPLIVEDLCRGAFASGGTGSGKSSGFARWLILLFLKMNIGGLVLCAKPDERKVWEELAEKTGRSDDLVILDEKSGLEFNFLEYEMSRKSRGGGEVSTITNLLMIAQDLYNNFSAGGGSGGDQEGGFWIRGLRRLINRLVSLLRLAGEPITIENLREALVSALTPDKVRFFEELLQEQRAARLDLDNPNTLEKLKIINRKMDQFLAQNYCANCLVKANQNLNSHSSSYAKDKRSFHLVYTYFTKEYPNLSPKTQSTFNEFFLGIAEVFLEGILRETFSKGISSEVRPERTYQEGKIIILDFSVKEYLLAGVFAQGLYKYMFQQALERRRPKEEENPQPVFLFVDESQLFMLETDATFQTTARSSLVMTVYLTQSINNYYFTIGGHAAEAKAKSLLSNLALKVFHANSCFDTNEFASQVIGKDYRNSHTISESGGSFSKEFQYQILPKEFSMLRTGGWRNDFLVDAIVNLTGRVWSTKENFLKPTFKQNNKV